MSFAATVAVSAAIRAHNRMNERNKAREKLWRDTLAEQNKKYGVESSSSGIKRAQTISANSARTSVQPFDGVESRNDRMILRRTNSSEQRKRDAARQTLLISEIEPQDEAEAVKTIAKDGEMSVDEVQAYIERTRKSAEAEARLIQFMRSERDKRIKEKEDEKAKLEDDTIKYWKGQQPQSQLEQIDEEDVPENCIRVVEQKQKRGCISSICKMLGRKK